MQQGQKQNLKKEEIKNHLYTVVMINLILLK